MASGDAHALHNLTLRYTRMLTALVMRICSEEADAEEVVADVLWQAWSDAKSYEPERGSVAGWLVTMARSRAIDRLRVKRARQTAPLGEPPAPSVIDPATEVDALQQAQIARAAVATLDNDERAALELAYFSDLSHSQIAQRLGIPLGTVKTRIRRAMIKLRGALSRQRD